MTHTHTHTHTHTDTHTPESSGRVIIPTHRPLPDNKQHLQETDIYAPGEIQTRSLGKQAAADPRLRPRGQQEQRFQIPGLVICYGGFISLKK